MGIFGPVGFARLHTLVDSSVLELHARDRRRGLRERMFGRASFGWRPVCISSDFDDFMLGVSVFVWFGECGNLASPGGVDSPELESCVGVQGIGRSLLERVSSDVSGCSSSQSLYVGRYSGPVGSV